MGFKNKRLDISEWRIQPIPFGDPYAMMETNWWALLGAVLFIFGIFASFKIQALIAVSILGLALGLISVLFRGRITRKDWKKVSAHCIDKECKSVLGSPGLNGGISKAWAFRLLCQFEFNGQQYTVTPAYWSTFFSEARVHVFLNKVLSADGRCQLWVNPKNPLQTELVSNDIKDFLLH